jgi:hypothetical protein
MALAGRAVRDVLQGRGRAGGGLGAGGGLASLAQGARHVGAARGPGAGRGGQGRAEGGRRAGPPTHTHTCTQRQEVCSSALRCGPSMAVGTWRSSSVISCTSSSVSASTSLSASAGGYGGWGVGSAAWVGRQAPRLGTAPPGAGAGPEGRQAPASPRRRGGRARTVERAALGALGQLARQHVVDERLHQLRVQAARGAGSALEAGPAAAKAGGAGAARAAGRGRGVGAGRGRRQAGRGRGARAAHLSMGTSRPGTSAASCSSGRLPDLNAST